MDWSTIDWKTLSGNLFPILLPVIMFGLNALRDKIRMASIPKVWIWIMSSAIGALLNAIGTAGPTPEAVATGIAMGLVGAGSYEIARDKNPRIK